MFTQTIMYYNTSIVISDQMLTQHDEPEPDDQHDVAAGPAGELRSALRGARRPRYKEIIEIKTGPATIKAACFRTYFIWFNYGVILDGCSFHCAHIRNKSGISIC